MENKTHNDFIIKTSPYGDKTILYAYLGSESVVTVPEGIPILIFLPLQKNISPMIQLQKSFCQTA